MSQCNGIFRDVSDWHPDANPSCVTFACRECGAVRYMSILPTPLALGPHERGSKPGGGRSIYDRPTKWQLESWSL